MKKKDHVDVDIDIDDETFTYVIRSVEQMLQDIGVDDVSMSLFYTSNKDSIKKLEKLVGKVMLNFLFVRALQAKMDEEG